MSSVVERALPKRGTGRGEQLNGSPVPGPDLEEMRRPKRYVNGRPVVDAPPVEQVQDEFSALEADANQRLLALQEARQRLAPEALTSDAGAENELQGVLSEIRAATEALENVRLARTERARRAREAHEQAGAAARAAAMAEAQRLQLEREQAVRAFDSAARTLSAALRDYSNVSVAQQRALSAAGRRGGLAPPSSIERALAHALSSGGVAPGVIELPPLSGRPAPLSELDPKHVAAAKDVTGETELHKGVDTNG